MGLSLQIDSLDGVISGVVFYALVQYRLTDCSLKPLVTLAESILQCIKQGLRLNESQRLRERYYAVLHRQSFRVARNNESLMPLDDSDSSDIRGPYRGSTSSKITRKSRKDAKWCRAVVQTQKTPRRQRGRKRQFPHSVSSIARR